ncbi:hypothetical protein UFOVP1344_2 [uncultured Caudovirales phage]|uniref:Uncharacterized protein n=1 Tax=uncultured Caudovirales phage TaxID=2100421 RepID=A0A6J5RZ15_9CAUD|nr:hypothetical protein UFOVP1005_2 [uncultured Caudovirales phage]CAB4199616.1 hypothetical protein UFOVP1344_2 [uncultured Caudovirales phage]CAB4218569.1 hypothetical protein UFOVP1602_38 [uncultured Caudovirales phage]
MAITGQFGRVITGSGSIASAISGIASEFANLRVTRIYNAFINKDVFEGSEMTAQRAIDLLNAMLTGLNPEGRTAMDITETLNSVRKSNRTRTLNEIDAKLLSDGAANGDYANKVRVIQEMLLDPTLSPDEKVSLQNELNSAIEDYLTNAENQFAAGGKITVNGKVMDFAGAANDEALLGLFDSIIRDNPGMAEKIGSMKDLANASVAVGKATALWLSKTRTNDADKLEGYKGQLSILRAAYEELQKSTHGLANSPEALKMLEDIRTLENNSKIAGDNISGRAADKRVSAAYDKTFGKFDAIETAIRKIPAVNAMLGNGKLAGLMMSNQNDALRIIDQFVHLNGGNSITLPDGTKVDVSRDGIYNVLIDARAEAKKQWAWAKGNEFVTPTDQKNIKSYLDATNALVDSVPMLKVEDAYDSAVGKMQDALSSANALDPNAKIKIFKQFAADLRGLAAKFTGLNAGAAQSLMNEANMYLTGKEPPEGEQTFGEYSGNTPGYTDNNGTFHRGADAPSGLGYAINPNVSMTERGILSSLQDAYGETELWNQGYGKLYTDGFTGVTVPVVAAEGVKEFQNGNSITMTSVVSTEVGGVTVQVQKQNTYLRYRIVGPGFESDTSDKGIQKSTKGWITAVQDKDGNTSYLITKIDNGGEKLVMSADVETIIAAMGGDPRLLMQLAGDQRVIVAGNKVLDAINGAKLGDGISADDIASGTIKDAVTKAGYRYFTDAEVASKNSIITAASTGKLIVDPKTGKITAKNPDYTTDHAGPGGVDAGVSRMIDITDQIPDDVRTSIITVWNSDIDKNGNGLPDWKGEGGLNPMENRQPYTGPTWGIGSSVTDVGRAPVGTVASGAYLAGQGVGTGTTKPVAKATPVSTTQTFGANSDVVAARAKAAAAATRTTTTPAVTAAPNSTFTGGVNADIRASALTTFMRNMPGSSAASTAQPSTGGVAAKKAAAPVRITAGAGTNRIAL